MRQALGNWRWWVAMALVGWWAVPLAFVFEAAKQAVEWLHFTFTGWLVRILRNGDGWLIKNVSRPLRKWVWQGSKRWRG